MGSVFSLKFAGTLLAPDEISLQSKEGEDAVVISQSTTCHFRVSFLLRFDDNSMTTVLSGTSLYPQPSTASQSIAAFLSREAEQKATINALVVLKLPDHRLSG